jgi:hypothetical protein
MSIATELQDLNDNILDAYTAVQGKGGTVPTNKNMVNLPTAISSISGGGSFIGIPREVSNQGVYQMPSSSFAFSFPSNATDIGPYALGYAFYNCARLTSADLSSLTAVSGSSAFYYAFYLCESMTSVDLSSVVTVSGNSAFQNAFNSCTSLSSLDLSSLTTVSGSSAFSYAFGFNRGLTSLDLGSLTTVIGSSAFSYAFNNCSSLTSINFSSLATISGNTAFSYAFNACTSLTSLSFPSLTTTSFGSRINQFNNMLKGCTGVTVHFPAAIQSTIGSWGSVQNGFSGTNTTVLFDL